MRVAMEPFFRPVLTPPRPAATVVLLRDGARGPEVLMLRRHGSSDVLGGAYVFPGGKVDDDDSGDALVGRAGAPAEALRARLGVTQDPDSKTYDATVAAVDKGKFNLKMKDVTFDLGEFKKDMDGYNAKLMGALNGR